jgi:hypothetical protein
MVVMDPYTPEDEAREEAQLARISELEAERDDWRMSFKGEEMRAEQAEADVKWLKEKVRLTEAQFSQRTLQWEHAEAALAELNARSCKTCNRPCDTVDESDYEGPDAYYCARYRAKEGSRDE